MGDLDICRCGDFRGARCVDCGCDLHAPADCDNYHHEFAAPVSHAEAR